MAANRHHLDTGAGHARTAWTTTPVAYNITNSDPMNVQDSTGRPCRQIVVGTSGTLIYTGVDGTAVTLPAMGQAWAWDVQAVSLSASSTGQNVVVIW